MFYNIYVSMSQDRGVFYTTPERHLFYNICVSMSQERGVFHSIYDSMSQERGLNAAWR